MILLGGRISFCVNALTQQHHPCPSLSLFLLCLTSLRSRVWKPLCQSPCHHDNSRVPWVFLCCFQRLCPLNAQLNSSQAECFGLSLPFYGSPVNAQHFVGLLPMHPQEALLSGSVRTQDSAGSEGRCRRIFYLRKHGVPTDLGEFKASAGKVCGFSPFGATLPLL